MSNGKGRLVGYWVATALFTSGMLASGIAQVTKAKDMMDLMAPLGYPPYFATVLGTWKILGVIAVLAPGFLLLKEWAYAGFIFAMSGAAISHIAVGHGIGDVIPPFMQGVFMTLSWYLRPDHRKLSVNKKSN